MKKIKYAIELKKNNRTYYTDGKIFLKSFTEDTVHIVKDIREALIVTKKSLPKIYQRFGRKNIIRRILYGGINERYK